MIKKSKLPIYWEEDVREAVKKAVSLK